MPHIAIDGVNLEYRLIPGRPEVPWLIFLHEGLGSVSLWRDFPDKVARRLGARALIYSRRGYGQSDGLAGPREPDFMHVEAEEVLPRLLAAFGITEAVLIGHSDGASIALIYAARHPDRVRRLVLMAPHVFLEPISLQGIGRAVELYQTQDLKARLARHHAHVDDAFLGWSRIWLSPRFTSWSLGPEASTLKSPALLIQGVGDDYGTLAQLDAIAEASKGPVRRLVLEDCGHAPHRDQEAAVLESIIRFLEADLSQV